MAYGQVFGSQVSDTKEKAENEDEKVSNIDLLQRYMEKFLQNKKEVSKLNTTFVHQHNKKLRKRCIIRHLDTYRVRWDLLVILMAIFNSFTLPMDIAY